MKDEIKEILDIEKYRNKEGYVENINLSPDEIHRLLDYITNLQEKVNQYENPDDMTLMFMWCDEKAKDKITNLQEELEVSQTNEETYRLEMQDITKCLGLKEDTIFDEVKEYATNLQEKSNNQTEEINRLYKQREKFMKKYGYLKEENKKLKEDIEILTSDDDDSWWLESENM